MRIKGLLAGAACVAALAAGLQGQYLDTLNSNTQQLQVTMTMDRSTYFPREAAAITITVKNPTSAPLQVIAPFSTECFRLSSEVGGDRCNFWSVTTLTPTTIIAPGEQRQFILNSYDSSFGAGISPLGGPMPGGSAPGQSASLILLDSYNGASASFAVATPTVDSATVVQVQDASVADPSTGDQSPVSKYVHVFSLRWNNQSYLCVSHPQHNSRAVTTLPLGTLQLPGVYKRIATSANPIVSITPTADAAGNLTITWVDSSGTKTVTPYPANGGDTVAPVSIANRVSFGEQTFEINTSKRNRLPWQITGIEVGFSKTITNANVNSISGVTTTSIEGLKTNTLVWKINPITHGSIATMLANSGANAITDAVGNALGGATTFSFTVLVGDVNDDGVVDPKDLAIVNDAVGGPYNIFADLNGDGIVDAKDVAILTAILNPQH